MDAVKDGTSALTDNQIDAFGRSFIWYSAYYIEFNDGSYLQDPGVLIVNPSDLNVTVSSEITVTETNASAYSQLISLKFVYSVVQEGGISNEIQSEYAKTLYFLDEEKPLIILSPEDNDIGRTNSVDKFFLIEAGVNYLADSRGTGFYLWEGISDTAKYAIDTNNSYTLIVSAEDAIDGNLDDEIERSIFDAEDNTSAIWGSGTLAGVDHLNKVYLVNYDKRR